MIVLIEMIIIGQIARRITRPDNTADIAPLVPGFDAARIIKAGCFIDPRTEDIDIKINPAELKVDVFRSSGPGTTSCGR